MVVDLQSTVGAGPNGRGFCWVGFLRSLVWALRGGVAHVYAIISNFEVYLYAIYVYYTSWGRSEGGSVTAQRGAV